LFALIVVKTDVGIGLLSGWATRSALLAFRSKARASCSAPRRRGDLVKRDERALGARAAIAVIFAFQILPTIIFIAALFAILYYIGVMQLIVARSRW
jgi:nucleoside permease NupC